MKKPRILWLNSLTFLFTGLGAMILVPWYGFSHGYDALQWLLMLVFLGYTGMSITAGYHRLWAHKAYEAHPIMRVLFALGGAFAVQNSIYNWAADHRRHHRHEDQRRPHGRKAHQHGRGQRGPDRDAQHGAHRFVQRADASKGQADQRGGQAEEDRAQKPGQRKREPEEHGHAQSGGGKGCQDSKHVRGFRGRDGAALAFRRRVVKGLRGTGGVVVEGGDSCNILKLL